MEKVPRRDRKYQSSSYLSRWFWALHFKNHSLSCQHRVRLINQNLLKFVWMWIWPILDIYWSYSMLTWWLCVECDSQSRLYRSKCPRQWANIVWYVDPSINQITFPSLFVLYYLLFIIYYLLQSLPLGNPSLIVPLVKSFIQMQGTLSHFITRKSVWVGFNIYLLE